MHVAAIQETEVLLMSIYYWFVVSHGELSGLTSLPDARTTAQFLATSTMPIVQTSIPLRVFTWSTL
jgi:hypothetical protein